MRAFNTSLSLSPGLQIHSQLNNMIVDNPHYHSLLMCGRKVTKSSDEGKAGQGEEGELHCSGQLK